MSTRLDEPLPPAAAKLLLALSAGQSLKSHRYLNGRKIFRLTSTENGSERVTRSAVELLHHLDLIYTNFKFPAATYSLTPRGRELADRLASGDH